MGRSQVLYNRRKAATRAVRAAAAERANRRAQQAEHDAPPQPQPQVSPKRSNSSRAQRGEQELDAFMMELDAPAATIPQSATSNDDFLFDALTTATGRTIFTEESDYSETMLIDLSVLNSCLKKLSFQERFRLPQHLVDTLYVSNSSPSAADRPQQPPTTERAASPLRRESLGHSQEVKPSQRSREARREAPSNRPKPVLVAMHNLRNVAVAHADAITSSEDLSSDAILESRRSDEKDGNSTLATSMEEVWRPSTSPRDRLLDRNSSAVSTARRRASPTRSTAQLYDEASGGSMARSSFSQSPRSTSEARRLSDDFPLDIPPTDTMLAVADESSLSRQRRPQQQSRQRQYHSLSPPSSPGRNTLGSTSGRISPPRRTVASLSPPGSRRRRSNLSVSFADHETEVSSWSRRQASPPQDTDEYDTVDDSVTSLRSEHKRYQMYASSMKQAVENYYTISKNEPVRRLLEEAAAGRDDLRKLALEKHHDKSKRQQALSPISGLDEEEDQLEDWLDSALATGTEDI